MQIRILHMKISVLLYEIKIVLFPLGSQPPGGCGQAFCYVCSQPWEPDHKNHFKCNKYIPKNDNLEQEKEAILRYNFYYDKFLNSQAAIEKAMKQQIQIKEKYIPKIFEYYQFTSLDCQFLEDIMKELIQAKVVLKWSYCYGYYITKADKQLALIFNHNQEEFEHACELLAISLIKLLDEIDKQNEKQQLNRPIQEKQKDFIDLKEKMLNASLKCVKMRYNLESAIKEGKIIM